MKIDYRDIAGAVMVMMMIALMMLASSCKKVVPLVRSEVAPETIKVNHGSTAIVIYMHIDGTADTVYVEAIKDTIK